MLGRWGGGGTYRLQGGLAVAGEVTPRPAARSQDRPTTNGGQGQSEAMRTGQTALSIPTAPVSACSTDRAAHLDLGEVGEVGESVREAQAQNSETIKRTADHRCSIAAVHQADVSGRARCRWGRATAAAVARSKRQDPGKRHDGKGRYLRANEDDRRESRLRTPAGDLPTKRVDGA